MYKAMLVEDHKWTIEGILQTIPWESLGIKPDHICVDGGEALSVLNETSVDLIITDIRMGAIDGIELTRQAKRLNPDVQIIIISAYQDFSYAYEAINLGAMAYVLKPIDNLELITKIKEAVEIISKMKEQNSALFDYLVQKTVAEGSADSEQDEKLRRQKIRVLVIPFQKNMLETQLLKKSLSSLNYTIHTFLHNDFIVSLVSCQNASEAFAEIGRLIKEPVIAAAGSVSNGASELNASFVHALKVYEYCFLNSLLGLHFYEASMEGYQVKNIGYIIDYNKIVFYAAASEAESTMKELNEVFNVFYTNKASSEIIRTYVFELITRLDSYFKANRDESLYNELDIKDSLSEIKKLHSFEALKAYVQDIFLRAIDILGGAGVHKTRPVTQRAVRYIQKNISNKNLGLSSAAKAIDINYVYLSKLFKEDYGMNFTDYINQYRLEKAKELLKDKNKKIKDICTEIGLEQKYFYHLFKKYEGITPNNYRSMRS